LPYLPGLTNLADIGGHCRSYACRKAAVSIFRICNIAYVEVHRLFSLVVEPQARSDFLHGVSFMESGSSKALYPSSDRMVG
jgi:hypothetical protein